MNGLLSKHKLGQMLQAAKQSPTLYLNIHLRPFKLWMINGKTCHVWTQLEHPGWTPRRVADICIMPIRPCFTGAQVVNGSKQFNLNFSKKCYWFSKGEVVIFVLYLGFKLPCKKLRHLEVCTNESFGDIVWIPPPLPSPPILLLTPNTLSPPHIQTLYLRWSPSLLLLKSFLGPFETN